MAHYFYTCHGPDGGCELKHRTISAMAECLNQKPSDRSGFRCSLEYASFDRTPLTLEEERALAAEMENIVRREERRRNAWRIPGITTKAVK